jgi:sugar/nucleoside kinase (ribokinase family)
MGNMSDIVGIGAAVYDILIVCDSYPAEDTKLKANRTKQSGGGPCATGLVAASKLGAKCGYIGVLSDDAGGVFLQQDFNKYNVAMDGIKIENGYSSFCSYVIINEKKSTRTCLFYRGDLPELSLDEKQKDMIKNAKILMVDGNELNAAIEAAKCAKENHTKVLYDAGGMYEGIDQLLPLADILIPSEEFALKYTGSDNAQDAAKKLFDMFRPDVVVITCGKQGGVLYDGIKLTHYPALEVEAVDTNGAGDVFHGAFAFAQVKGYDYYKSCIFSSGVSALKCTRLGAREGAPTYSETINFLKHRNLKEP